MSAIRSARLFAQYAHRTQVRRYSGEPYFTHVERVAKLVDATEGTLQMVQAAYLHDVVEDAGVSPALLRELFGPVVASYVAHLTDEYTKERFPTWNRAQRKRAEARRLGAAPGVVQTIKLADMYDNGRDILAHDPAFGRVYMAELRDLYERLTLGDERLRRLVFSTLMEGELLLPKVDATREAVVG